MIETRVCFGLEGKMAYRECGTNMGGLNPGIFLKRILSNCLGFVLLN